MQSVAAGFTARDVFITEGQYIYKYDFSSGTISPAPFAQVGCPFSDHSSLTFDKVGTFGFKMIVACENGPIWTVDGSGNVDFVASTTTVNPPLITHPEGPAIPPLSFGPLGGQILVGDEDLHQVTAIKNDGTVTYNAFNWAPGFEALPENVNVIPDPACGFGCIPNQPQGSFFQAIEDYGFFLYYGPLDFQGLGGNVIVTNEAQPPATTAGTLLVTYNAVTNAYDTTVFDPIFNFTINEGAKFVECDAVTPTPTPTATFTPTPTPTATATFTPTATATFTPTATATATFTPTPTPTPTPTATPSATCSPSGIFVFEGNSATHGTAGNIRTYTMNGITVKVSAFSRADSNGAWETSYLGVYPQGLGVTNSHEGNGDNNRHTVGNLNGYRDYVLFEFSTPLIIDQVYLDFVVNDSDMAAWYGTKTDPINNHNTLSDSFLSGLGDPRGQRHDQHLPTLGGHQFL